MFFDHLIEEYERTCIELDQKQARSLRESADALAGRDLDPAFAKQYAHLRKQEIDFCDAIESADETMFGKLDVILSDDQRQQLQRVRADRCRRRCFTSVWGLSRSKVDLSYEIEASDLDQDQRMLLDHVLAEYERRLTPGWTNLERLYKATEPELVANVVYGTFDDLGVELIQGSTQASSRGKRCNELNAAIHSQRGHMELEIAQLNDSFIERLAVLLPDDVGRLLVARYRERCYQRVHPDRTDPEPAYLLIVSSPTLAPDIQRVVESRWSVYRRAYEGICHALRLETDRWQVELVMTGAGNGASSHEAQMTKLGKKRYELNNDWMNSIRPLLPPDELARVAPMLEVLTNRIVSERSQLLSRNPNRVDRR